MSSTPGAVITHRFNGPPFTVGIEEELMLIDPAGLDLAQGIERILADTDACSGPGQVKPELMQSVLEIATDPCPDIATAGFQLRELRGRVCRAADRHGLAVAAAGTHPTARWDQQAITDRSRYRKLIDELGWIARQELIFGTHVHVGVAGADEAIYVADGIRRHLPLLLALSCNSPVWQGEVTGMQSVRTPIFRQFPRVGVPPHYGSWEIFASRVETMMRTGTVPDYSYLWWDVRPHPNLGTVEVRVFDQQTEVEHTVALAALTLCLVCRYVSNFESRRPLVEVPSELIDDGKVRAALTGLETELVDLPSERRAPARLLVAELVEELAPEAREMGCERELEVVAAMGREGTGADRQLTRLESEGVDGLVRAAILEE